MTRHHHKTITDPGGTTWRQHAACAGMNPDIFHPTRGDNVTAAKTVCKTCPVAAECLEYALTNCIDSGVWGGTSERERRKIRRRRRAQVAS